MRKARSRTVCLGCYWLCNNDNKIRILTSLEVLFKKKLVREIVSREGNRSLEVKGNREIYFSHWALCGPFEFCTLQMQYLMKMFLKHVKQEQKVNPVLHLDVTSMAPTSTRKWTNERWRLGRLGADPALQLAQPPHCPSPIPDSLPPWQRVFFWGDYRYLIFSYPEKDPFCPQVSSRSCLSCLSVSCRPKWGETVLHIKVAE